MTRILKKRVFDFILALLLLVPLSCLFPIIWLLAIVDTSSNGFFLQERIGQYGNTFLIYKLKTIHPKTRQVSNVGSFLRKSKLDEIPQLINIIKGEMSFVGPRPDVKGYYDSLAGEYSKILELKPGLSSEAALKYWNESSLLEQKLDAKKYNDEVIFKDKVNLNLNYYYNNSFCGDLKILMKTMLHFLNKS